MLSFVFELLKKVMIYYQSRSGGLKKKSNAQQAILRRNSVEIMERKSFRMFWNTSFLPRATSPVNCAIIVHAQTAIKYFSAWRICGIPTVTHSLVSISKIQHKPDQTRFFESDASSPLVASNSNKN